MLPPAGGFDRLAAPNTPGSVKIKKRPGSVARGMLEEKVTIQKDRLNAGEQRIVRIEEPPSRRDHSDRGIVKTREGIFQESGRRQEIGVENREDPPPRLFQTRRERPCFESRPVVAVEMADMKSL